MKKLNPITMKNRQGTKCPICNGEVVYRCRCKVAESKCENGHEQHCCGVHRTVVIGKRDDNIPMDVCTCK